MFDEQAPNTADAMKRYKAGKAGFTDKAHLKAKGLIARSDGTKKEVRQIQVMKSFKEYTGVTGIRVGGIDAVHPIASLGDKPPKGKGSRAPRAIGLTAEKNPRIARKPGQKAGSDKHSDLYTDENPKGTIHGLGFTDRGKAVQSINKIKGSGKTHAHKIQAAIAMSQRAKVASERAKDPEKKKDLASAHRVYQQYINKIKKEGLIWNYY